MRVLILLGLLCQWTVSHGQTLRFEIPESEIYATSSPAVLEKMTYEMQLEVYVLQNSNWTDESVKHELIRAADVWQQCGVKFRSIAVMGISPGSRYSSINGNDDLRLVNSLSINSRPAVFFVHEIAGEPFSGYSYREINDYPYKEFPLKGTIWIPDLILTDEYKAKRDPVYSTLAHEIAHVILNLGHIGTRNILGSTPSLVNATISPNQCKRLRLGTYVHKIK